MKKSVYSLVLMDEVVKAVDEKAYQLNTSRSNLINQILAENLSCITPEMRMRSIFSSISNLLNTDFQIQQMRSDSLLNIKMVLEYKYRPTVNYKVELSRSPDIYLGSLKVHIRTQSAQFISLFNNFFTVWINFETEILSQLGIYDYSCNLESGCFTRMLLNENKLSDEEIGTAIYSYISLLDHSIKLYFSDPQNFQLVLPRIKSLYNTQLKIAII